MENIQNKSALIPSDEIRKKLYQFRSEQENFLGDSFDPIIAYGKHAAIVHYSATEETDIPFEARGMVLADTGGHYLEGSTDITRTVVLGPVTDSVQCTVAQAHFSEVGFGG